MWLKFPTPVMKLCGVCPNASVVEKIAATTLHLIVDSIGSPPVAAHMLLRYPSACDSERGFVQVQQVDHSSVGRLTSAQDMGQGTSQHVTFEKARSSGLSNVGMSLVPCPVHLSNDSLM